MNYVLQTLQRHLQILKRHPLAFVLLILTALVILYTSYTNTTLIHALAYLGAIWLCSVIVDVVLTIKPLSEPALILKRPVKKEIFLIVSCTLLGLTFLMIRFFSDWEHLAGWIKLSALPLMLFTFPIALALIYLFVYKYKFKELGINLNYWYLPLLLHPLWGTITLLFAPEVSHWREGYQEYGIIGFIVTGVLGAALAEEFSRMLIQTRLAFLSKNMGVGVFVSSVIWSAMHIPVGYSQDPQHFTLITALMGVIYLVPLGLFWGYLTHRTQSLLPAVLMHGFNLWGLQNF